MPSSRRIQNPEIEVLPKPAFCVARAVCRLNAVASCLGSSVNVEASTKIMRIAVSCRSDPWTVRIVTGFVPGERGGGAVGGQCVIVRFMLPPEAT